MSADLIAELRAGTVALSVVLERHDAFVRHVAKRYAVRARRLGMEMEDLLQEGRTGLIRALELFDPARGNTFTTYAKYWVTAMIGRYLKRCGRTIRVPEYVLEKSAHDRDLAASLPSTTSLDTTQPGEEDDRALVARMVGVDGRELLTALIADEDDKGVRRMLAALTPRQVEVLRLHLRCGMPFDAIGRRLGITRQRVQQIEQQALRVLAQRPSGDGPIPPSWSIHRWWTAEEEARLLQRWEAAGRPDAEECGRLLAAPLGRPSTAIAARLRRLLTRGQRRRWARADPARPQPTRSNRWTAEQDAELRQLYPSGHLVRDIAVRLGKSNYAVTQRVRRLGLWRSGGIAVSDLARELGVARGAVDRLLVRCGVAIDRTKRPWLLSSTQADSVRSVARQLLKQGWPATRRKIYADLGKRQPQPSTCRAGG